MPASAGRVRMPHNNRMSTSSALKTSSIWQKTIGHDPHAESDRNATSEPTEAEREAATQKAANVMLMARQQNLTGDSTNRDGTNFTRQLYQGLKGGKKKRHAEIDNNNINNSDNYLALQQSTDNDGIAEHRLADPQRGNALDSSSEEEYVVSEAKPKAKEASHKGDKERKKRSKSSSHKRRKRRRDYSSSDNDSSSDSSSSSSSSEEERRRRRKRQKKRERQKRSRSRHSSSSDEETDSDDNDRRRQRHGGRSHDDKSSRHRHRRDSKADQRPRSRTKDATLEPFLASTTFAGSKKGYVFKSGPKGVGYYEDTGKKIFMPAKL